MNALPESQPSWRQLALRLLWIAVKLTLVAALLNRNASNFIYAGF